MNRITIEGDSIKIKGMVTSTSIWLKGTAIFPDQMVEDIKSAINMNNAEADENLRLLRQMEIEHRNLGDMNQSQAETIRQLTAKNEELSRALMAQSSFPPLRERLIVAALSNPNIIAEVNVSNGHKRYNEAINAADTIINQLEAQAQDNK